MQTVVPLHLVLCLWMWMELIYVILHAIIALSRLLVSASFTQKNLIGEVFALLAISTALGDDSWVSFPLSLVEMRRIHLTTGFSGHVRLPWMAGRHISFSSAWLAVFLFAFVWCSTGIHWPKILSTGQWLSPGTIVSPNWWCVLSSNPSSQRPTTAVPAVQLQELTGRTPC